MFRGGGESWRGGVGDERMGGSWNLQCGVGSLMKSTGGGGSWRGGVTQTQKNNYLHFTVNYNCRNFIQTLWIRILIFLAENISEFKLGIKLLNSADFFYPIYSLKKPFCIGLHGGGVACRTSYYCLFSRQQPLLGLFDCHTFQTWLTKHCQLWLLKIEMIIPNVGRRVFLDFLKITMISSIQEMNCCLEHAVIEHWK